MNKIIGCLLIIMTTFCSISQTKKDQLEILNNRVDSLNTLLSIERSSNLKKISELNSTIKSLENQISTVNESVNKLNVELQSSKFETTKKQQEISILKAQEKSKSDSLNILRDELEELKQLEIKNFSFSKFFHPYQTDGYYSLNGSYETNKRRIYDKMGNHIGLSNYNWNAFDDVYYFEGYLFSGILYFVVNQRLAGVGQVINGKKSGIWVNSITDIKNENLGLIDEVCHFENGTLINKKVKDFTGHDEFCSEMEFFDLDAINSNLGILTDMNGHGLGREDFNDENGLYTPNHNSFNGIGFANESGACLTFMATFKNGYEDGLCIYSNEAGYIYSIGEMRGGKKTGRWFENQYTGEVNKIANYLYNQLNGIALHFLEEKYVGNGTYEMNELVNCKGTCE